MEVSGKQSSTCNQGPNHANQNPNQGVNPVCPKSSLAVLKEVQKAYEDRLEVISKIGGQKKLQMTVDALREWVNDLMGQNSLLAQAVEELEADATARLLLERARRQEPDKQKKSNSSLKDLKTMNDTLQKEINAKEREIRRLNKDVQQYEQTIVNMRSERCNPFQSDTPRKDAEAMVGMCLQSEHVGVSELAGFSAMLREEANKYQDKIRRMEANLKSSGESVRALRKVNVALSEELHALRRVCAALDEQARAANLRTQFKDDIIREMRRQLRQAKTKLKEANGTDAKSSNGDPSDLKMAATHSFSKLELRERDTSDAGTCVRQPRRAGTIACYQRDTPLHPESDDCRTPRLDGSGEDYVSNRH